MFTKHFWHVEVWETFCACLGEFFKVRSQWQDTESTENRACEETLVRPSVQRRSMSWWGSFGREKWEPILDCGLAPMWDYVVHSVDNNVPFRMVPQHLVCGWLEEKLINLMEGQDLCLQRSGQENGRIRWDMCLRLRFWHGQNSTEGNVVHTGWGPNKCLLILFSLCDEQTTHC